MTDNINYERHTKASISPPTTMLEFSKCLLSPSELEASIGDYKRLMVEGKVIGASTGIMKRLLQHIKPESLATGKVVLLEGTSFYWNIAKPKICKKYGLTDLHTIGTRNKVNGFIMSSLVMVTDPDEQIRKYATILRAIKQTHPEWVLNWEECQQTIACDPRLTKMLQDLISQRQPKSLFHGKEE